MRQDGVFVSFLAFVAAAAAFVWLTSMTMPQTVAAHFASSGAPNGFMPRPVYIGFMLTFVIGLPVVAILATRRAIARPGARINLPNPDYWLGGERRAETIARIRRGVLQFGFLLIAFLCYAHWLVVRANAAPRPHLANRWLVGGVVVLAFAMMVWLALLLRSFRRPD